MTFTYACVLVGVNQTPNAPTLEFAEKDATDFARFVTSALGPLPDSRPNDLLLLGARATAREILDRLSVRKFADALTFYFSGHGSPEGIAASDRTIHHTEIAEALRASRAKRTLLILDSCYAASYLNEVKVGGLAGAVNSSWIATLVKSVPGTRAMFASGAHQTAKELPALENGAFTHALLTAMKWSPADLGSSTISAEMAFNVASRLVEGGQTPKSKGPLEDFPVALSQYERPIGTAFARIEISGRHAIHVLVGTEDRRHLPASLRVEYINSAGQLMHSYRETLPAPSANGGGYRRSFPLPETDAVARRDLQMCGYAPLRVVAYVRDELDHQLAAVSCDLTLVG